MVNRPAVFLLVASILISGAGNRLAGSAALPVRGQGASTEDHFPHTLLDDVLDLYVRDGLVYYLALKRDRAKLDRYITSLDVAAATYGQWSKPEKEAFWINAYNAFVLRAVIDHYPIRGTGPNYPANSIRQIPGAFDKLPHLAAGRTVTLDVIEKTILPEFKDPRLHLALGRGALGSGRLRSEAYTAARLESQLTDVAREFATRPAYILIDAMANRIAVSPIIGWHDAEFTAAYAAGDGGGSRFASRSPIERAIIALLEPHLLPTEREFLQKNEFEVRYQAFNWRLNDLTGGRPD
ncbi:MAG: DUF547 domain-containing protein [Acidobacteria bacterium]|nr:DUF547 domain-containing protein [Acidobacteriota bacterium]